MENEVRGGGEGGWEGGNDGRRGARGRLGLA